jgi:alpha-D-xyloside xylohydrolase
MRLLPYWYTAFAQYHYQGTPVVRPMPLVEGFTPPSGLDPNAITDVAEVKDQYLVGDVLLVAPIRPGARSRRVALPPGRWFDFYTGRLAGEHETIEVAPPLSQIPLFVRDGGLIPMIGERQFVPASDEVLPLDVRHYGATPGEMMLYDDDGGTFDYERGSHTWTRLSVQRDAAGQWRGSVTPDSNGQRWHYSDVRWTGMTR